MYASLLKRGHEYMKLNGVALKSIYVKGNHSELI